MKAAYFLMQMFCVANALKNRKARRSPADYVCKKMQQERGTNNKAIVVMRVESQWDIVFD